ncbi:hypothetical protein ACKWTF_005089 [Chironomus riparius]
MWTRILSLIVFCCMAVKLGDCKNSFIVTGSNTIPFQTKYSVAVASTGYNKPETLQIKIYGKSGNETIYENIKNVVLKDNALEIVNFDLKDQVPGNYFIKVKNQTFKQATRLHLNTKKFSVFIQTDKAIYKPGEKVQFRVLVLNADTKPFSTQSVEVYITDGSNNRIKQFDKVFTRRGVFRHALQLSDEPVLGSWMIHVKVNEQDSETTKNFEVAEYVLPKFEVNIVTKDKVFKDDDIVVSYNAKYTYGKEVEGSAIVNSEIIDYYWWGNPARVVEKSLDNSTKTTSLSIKNDLNLVNVYWIQTVRLTVTFTEALTGNQRNATATVDVYENLYSIQLINSDNNVKANLPFTVKAFVKDIYEVPVTDNKEPINFEVTYTYEYPPETKTTLAPSTPSDGVQTTTNGDLTTVPLFGWWNQWIPAPTKVVTYKKYLRNGMTELSFTLEANVTSISISSTYKGAHGYSYAGVKPTQNKQFIEIKVPEKLPMDRASSLEIISNVKINRINYLVFARNNIVSKGHIKGSNSKSLKFNFQPTFSMTPSAKIIAFYVTSDGEIISDYKFLNFDNLLPNFVNIDLSQSETRPSSLLNISVKSKPLSYVGLLGVDQSVLLLKSGNDIEQDMITNELFGYTYLDQYNNDWEEPTNYNYYTDFSALDVFILTNANPQYEEIIRYRPDFINSQGAAPTTSTGLPPPTTNEIIPEVIPSGGAEIVTRKNFPETWLFDCIDNVKGSKNIIRKVPDTITSWVITGFSMNFQHGLGLTKEPTKLTVFMPFFISLNLPYSIKRGEIISIQAIIFNYMMDDCTATVTMFNENQEFEFVEKTLSQKNLIKKIKTKANSGTSVEFIIRALKVGYVTLKIEALTVLAGDRIEQKLLVEPEGITRYINQAILIDLRTQNNFMKTIDIVVPEDIVSDSLKIEASLIGDILGPTLDNLDKLIQMPYGCGEQNMLNFVPDIIVLDYLTSANRLTPNTETKLKSYMESGYQRELIYKRDDGSFSAFGKNDQSGSTWLTAFVARSFNQASKYITIDQNVISQSLAFLQNVQANDGSFTENGVVHHKAMQGGSSSGTGLTSYVLLTFLENEELTATYKKTITKAVDNIVMHVSEIDDVYTMSIVAYTLYLAGRTSTADMLLKKLDQQANNTDGTRHWDKKTNDLYLTSLSTETSSYALLAYLQAFKDVDALLIAKWLVSQRNSFGGFESTQDTVVGLLALSKIAAKISSKTLSIKVDLKYQNNMKTLNVDLKNALVLQKVELPSTIRKIDITASGNGFTIVQISYHYNLKEPKIINNFILSAKVSAKVDYFFTLETCVGLNNMNQSNMAVIEISTPSGYIFESERLNSVVGSSSNVKRVETKNGNTLANVYLDYLQPKIQCLYVNATKSFNVADQKPASIVVYDYYANDLRTETFYTPAKIVLCDICTPNDCPDVC